MKFIFTLLLVAGVSALYAQKSEELTYADNFPGIMFDPHLPLNTDLSLVFETPTPEPAVTGLKWNRVILSSGLLVLSGFADGTSEVLKIKYDRFNRVFPKANDEFWDYNISWDNKYKEGNPPEPAFPGAKTTLVWTTDGYHLMRMVRNSTMIAAMVIPIGGGFHRNWKSYVKEGIIYYFAYTAGFNLAYDVVFK